MRLIDSLACSQFFEDYSQAGEVVRKMLTVLTVSRIDLQGVGLPVDRQFDELAGLIEIDNAAGQPHQITHCRRELAVIIRRIGKVLHQLGQELHRTSQILLGLLHLLRVMSQCVSQSLAGACQAKLVARDTRKFTVKFLEHAYGVADIPTAQSQADFSQLRTVPLAARISADLGLEMA